MHAEVGHGGAVAVDRLLGRELVRAEAKWGPTPFRLILAPVIALAWFGGGFFGLRKLFKSRARKRAESLQRVFEQIDAEVTKKLEPK